jgi:hypothetical protein
MAALLQEQRVEPTAVSTAIELKLEKSSMESAVVKHSIVIAVTGPASALKEFWNALGNRTYKT